MVIEINKDIDKYQESIVMGLSAKQLLFSIVAVICGGGVVLLLYPYIGLTGSAYVAIPVVAPIALEGFYIYNEMSFYEVMKRKFYMIFQNHALVYLSTEGEAVIKEYRLKSQKKATIKFFKGKKVTKNLTEKKNIAAKERDEDGSEEKTKDGLVEDNHS